MVGLPDVMTRLRTGSAHLRSTSILLLTFVLAACSSDWLPFSSGEIDGEVAPIPADWSDVADAEVIQLETSPAEPYAVNLWIIAMNGSLYVHAGANRATWVENIESNPLVRVGYGGRIYELQASRVTSQEEFEALSEIYKKKYGNYPRNRNIEEIYLFRLTPRSGNGPAKRDSIGSP